MLIAPALRFAQADAVDDGGMVERVADDGVLLAQQWLEETAIGIEGCGVEDGVLAADRKRARRASSVLVQILRAADEAHRAEPVAVRAQGLVGRLNHRRVTGQAEVVVGTQVDDLAAVCRAHQRALGRRDHAFALVQAGVTQALQLAAQVGQEIVWVGHGVVLGGAARRMASIRLRLVRYIEHECSIMESSPPRQAPLP